MGICVSHVKAIATHMRGEAEGLSLLNVCTNTRRQIDNGLFVPIAGERFDGHHFLLDAIHSGAVAALWAKGTPVPEDLSEGFPLFFVEDTVKALQELAKRRCNEVNPIVVAITGSNGKTTTKDIVAAVLATQYKTHKTNGNFNNHIGLPLTLLELPDDCEVCVLEMGMNHFGEIACLSKIAQPDIALITNIGESHIENVGSREGITQAKLEIIEGMVDGVLMIDGDEPLLTSKNKIGLETITCGYQTDNDWCITSVSATAEGSTFTLKEETYYIPLLGAHNVKNTAFAIAISERLNISIENVRAGLADLMVTGMRLETVAGKEESLLINDAYNASPTSMRAAIQTLADLPDYKRKVAVLGDMFELGHEEERLHREVAGTISKEITDVIAIGEKGKWVADACMEINRSVPDIKSFADKEAALPYLESLLGPETAMLFKASRLAGLETLVATLREGGNAP